MVRSQKYAEYQKKMSFCSVEWAFVAGREGSSELPNPRAYMAVESTVSIGYWRLTTGLETWDPMGNAGGGGGGGEGEGWVTSYVKAHERTAPQPPCQSRDIAW